MSQKYQDFEEEKQEHGDEADNYDSSPSEVEQLELESDMSLYKGEEQQSADVGRDVKDLLFTLT